MEKTKFKQYLKKHNQELAYPSLSKPATRQFNEFPPAKVPFVIGHQASGNFEQGELICLRS
tara:strand:- start:1579 stop:1761 length:183 start_codon:yes stop_codon:yes gene_type:complete